jgi:uncharacterized membrane protein YczE
VPDASGWSHRASSLLRGSRTVPRTRFTAPSVWRPTPASFSALIVGLWLFGTGDALILASALGASPWSVLAQGLSVRTGLGIEWTTFAVSIGVLALWIPLRQRPGLGTVMNIFVIALALGVTYPRVTTPDSLAGQLGLVFLGIGLIGLGSGFYLTSGHGPGPRDGWMPGLHRVTGWPVGRVRLLIEVTVLIAGWALGGVVGIGTALFALLVGQSVAVGLTIAHRLFPSASDGVLDEDGFLQGGA